jgi:hypothetical protein
MKLGTAATLIQATCILLIVAIGCGISNSRVEGMKELMKREVPIGSGEEQVLAFLKTQNIQEYGADKENKRIDAMIRNVSRLFFLFPQDLRLTFFLDKEGKVSDYSVEILLTAF